MSTDKSNGLSRYRWILDFPWSLGVSIGLIVFFTPHKEWHGDLQIFREGVQLLRYPYWARWLFWLLAQPAEPVAYIFLTLVCTVSIYFAIRVFGGKPWMVFTSFSFAWTLFYGNIDALVVGGLALAWWALNNKKPYLIGVGLAIASHKPQLTLPLMIAFWWWSPSRWKSLVVPAVMFGLSLVQWGWWIPEWLNRLQNSPDMVLLSRNISLFPEVGWFVLLIWPIVIWLPLPRERKILAIAAATAFSTPYFPLPSSILFLSMPIPWWIYAITQVPILGNWLGYWLYYPMKALPPIFLVWSIYPFLQATYLKLRRSN